MEKIFRPDCCSWQEMDHKLLHFRGLNASKYFISHHSLWQLMQMQHPLSFNLFAIEKQVSKKHCSICSHLMQLFLYLAAEFLSVLRVHAYTDSLNENRQMMNGIWMDSPQKDWQNDRILICGFIMRCSHSVLCYYQFVENFFPVFEQEMSVNLFKRLP